MASLQLFPLIYIKDKKASDVKLNKTNTYDIKIYVLEINLNSSDQALILGVLITF